MMAATRRTAGKGATFLVCLMLTMGLINAQQKPSMHFQVFRNNPPATVADVSHLCLAKKAATRCAFGDPVAAAGVFEVTEMGEIKTRYSLSCFPDLNQIKNRTLLIPFYCSNSIECSVQVTISILGAVVQPPLNFCPPRSSDHGEPFGGGGGNTQDSTAVSTLPYSTPTSASDSQFSPVLSVGIAAGCTILIFATAYLTLKCWLSHRKYGKENKKVTSLLPLTSVELVRDSCITREANVEKSPCAGGGVNCADSMIAIDPADLHSGSSQGNFSAKGGQGAGGFSVSTGGLVKWHETQRWVSEQRQLRNTAPSRASRTTSTPSPPRAQAENNTSLSKETAETKATNSPIFSPGHKTLYSTLSSPNKPESKMKSTRSPLTTTPRRIQAPTFELPDFACHAQQPAMQRKPSTRLDRAEHI